MDRKAEIGSRWKQNDATTRACGCFNGAIDGIRIQYLAVSFGAVLAHVKYSGAPHSNACSFLSRGSKRRDGHRGSRGSHASGAKEIPAQRVETLHPMFSLNELVLATCTQLRK